MITLDEFNEKYITLDFDSYLQEQDNNLVNSNEYYLQYKNNYLLSSKNNYNLLKTLLKDYNELSLNYTKTATKYVYNYINDEEYNLVNNKLKKLIILQKTLFDNFINHIKFLNNT